MPTLIDSLIVKLGLSGDSEFKAKSKAATEAIDKTEKASEKLSKSNKKLKDTHKETAKSFSNVTASAAKFLAVIGGVAAIRAFTLDFIATNSELGRFSRNIGLSTETVSAWQQAAEQMGGSAQGVAGTLDMLSKSQTELMLTGQSSLIPYFSALGVALVGVHGKARPVDDILLDLSERFSKLDRTTANNMGRMMGIDQGTMNLLLQGRRAVEAQIAERKKTSAVTKAQADEAERLQRSLAELKQEWVAFGRELLRYVEPVLRKVLGWFKSLTDWIRENQDTVKTFLTVLVGGLTALVLVVNRLAILATLTNPLTLIVAAVIALAGAIALLKNDYDTWKAGGDSLIDWEKWKPGIDAAAKGIQWLADIAEKAFSKIIKWSTMAQDVIHGGTAWRTPAAPTMKSGDKSLSGPAQLAAYFEKAGWSREQAAGIAANLWKESHGNPGAVGDNGKAYGLAQWHPDRQAAFKKFAGKDIRDSDLWEQLAFVQYELTQGSEKRAGDLLRGAKTAQEAGGIVSKYYERPADTQGEASKRGDFASSLLNGIPGASAALQGAGTASGKGVSIDNSKSMHIGEVKVYSAATDAEGVARDLNKSLDYLFTSQANTGLS